MKRTIARQILLVIIPLALAASTYLVSFAQEPAGGTVPPGPNPVAYLSYIAKDWLRGSFPPINGTIPDPSPYRFLPFAANEGEAQGTIPLP